MQVSVEVTSGLERRLTMGVPAEKLDNVVNERLAKAQKNLRLPGFRPGKVPMNEVRRRLGNDVRLEAMGELMQDTFFEVIRKENIEPAGMPRFEPISLEPGEEVTFSATFEVFPEVALVDFANLSVAKPTSEINDEDVKQLIEDLRKQRASWKEKEGAAENGDQVNINYLGTLEGEAFDGGTADGQNLVLGSGQMIPGFEDGIEGMKAGEQKTIDVTFPEDYHAENLKGQAVQFAITVNKVEERELPEIDAEFMAQFDVQDGDLEAFHAEVKKNMERTLKQNIEAKIKNQVMDALVEAHEFDLPKALVDGEVLRMRQQMVQQFGGGQQFDSSMLPAELFTEQAERSVRLGLVVRGIVEAHDVKADEDKVRAHVEEIAAQYQDPQELIDWVYSNPEQLQQLEGAVIEQQVVDLVLEKAKVEEKTLSYAEAVSQEA